MGAHQVIDDEDGKGEGGGEGKLGEGCRERFGVDARVGQQRSTEDRLLPTQLWFHSGKNCWHIAGTTDICDSKVDIETLPIRTMCLRKLPTGFLKCA